MPTARKRTPTISPIGSAADPGSESGLAGYDPEGRIWHPRARRRRAVPTRPFLCLIRGGRSPTAPPGVVVIPVSDKSYLKDLILLRNDPSKVPLVRELALQGEMDAQYAMGLIYAEGRGVEIDLAQSHYWLSMAVEQGDRDAELLRNIVGSRMTDAEYAAAKRLRAGPGLQVVK